MRLLLTACIMWANPETELVQLFAAAGYPRATAGLLHPSDLFIDLSGEDIRRRLYLTQDADGQELCLRPEFTIPLCRAAAARSGPVSAAVSYYGPVFRHRPAETGEFIQAGVESLGRHDTAAADAEMISLALAVAAALGGAKAQLRLGDVGLLDAMLTALAAPASFSRRLKRRLATGKAPFAERSATASAGVDSYGGVLAALEGAGPAAARAFVTDMLNMTGVQVSGGRSVGEIAERFLSKARAGEGELPEDRRAILARFLALEGHPDAVAEGVRALAQDTGLDLTDAIAAYEARTGFMAAAGVEIETIQAQARFVRNLDYYTGMTFEITDPVMAEGKPLVGGGRYDRLLERLGAAEPVPAVGFAVWIERFAGGNGP